METMEVVCGIIEENGKFLIARRAEGIHENVWEFPGGKVEVAETGEAAVVREIREELELDIKVKEELCDIMDHRSDIDIHVRAFLCTIENGTIHLHAHHEYRFVNVKELFHYGFEEADKEILETLMRRYNDEKS